MLVSCNGWLCQPYPFLQSWRWECGFFPLCVCEIDTGKENVVFQTHYLQMSSFHTPPQYLHAWVHAPCAHTHTHTHRHTHMHAKKSYSLLQMRFYCVVLCLIWLCSCTWWLPWLHHIVLLCFCVMLCCFDHFAVIIVLCALLCCGAFLLYITLCYAVYECCGVLGCAVLHCAVKHWICLMLKIQINNDKSEIR